jgi:hypothetical protein
MARYGSPDEFWRSISVEDHLLGIRDRIRILWRLPPRKLADSLIGLALTAQHPQLVESITFSLVPSTVEESRVEVCCLIEVMLLRKSAKVHKITDATVVTISSSQRNLSHERVLAEMIGPSVGGARSDPVAMVTEGIRERALLREPAMKRSREAAELSPPRVVLDRQKKEVMMDDDEEDEDYEEEGGRDQPPHAASTQRPGARIKRPVKRRKIEHRHRAGDRDDDDGDDDGGKGIAHQLRPSELLKEPPGFFASIGSTLATIFS